MNRNFRRKQAAIHAIRMTVAKGSELYDRSRLSRLIPIDVGALAAGPEATRTVLKRLASALRSERARAGHWTYDLNRHLGLLQALSAERARLAAETSRAKK